MRLVIAYAQVIAENAPRLCGTRRYLDAPSAALQMCVPARLMFADAPRTCWRFELKRKPNVRRVLARLKAQPVRYTRFNAFGFQDCCLSWAAQTAVRYATRSECASARVNAPSLHE